MQDKGLYIYIVYDGTVHGAWTLCVIAAVDSVSSAAHIQCTMSFILQWK